MGRCRASSRRRLYRTACGHVAWLHSNAIGGRHVVGAGGWCSPPPLAPPTVSACTVIPYAFHASDAILNRLSVAGNSAACCRAVVSLALTASSRSGAPRNSASVTSAGHDAGVRPRAPAAVRSPSSPPPSSMGSDARSGAHGERSPSAYFSYTSHNVMSVSSPNPANVRYASPRAVGSSSATRDVSSAEDGIVSASAPAGRSVDAAAPRPVDGNRAGTRRTVARPPASDAASKSAAAVDDVEHAPPRLTHAIIASPTPPSFAGDAGSGATVETPGASSGGASAASHSERTAGIALAAAAPRSATSSSASAHAAVSFRGDSATRSRSPLTGGVVTFAAHPPAGAKYASRSSTHDTRAATRSRVAKSGAERSTAFDSPHARMIFSRKSTCSSRGIGTVTMHAMTTTHHRAAASRRRRGRLRARRQWTDRVSLPELFRRDSLQTDRDDDAAD
eukprot:31342-Pelagococcus_subviridis.AAC.36